MTNKEFFISNLKAFYDNYYDMVKAANYKQCNGDFDEEDLFQCEYITGYSICAEDRRDKRMRAMRDTIVKYFESRPEEYYADIKVEKQPVDLQVIVEYVVDSWDSELLDLEEEVESTYQEPPFESLNPEKHKEDLGIDWEKNGIWNLLFSEECVNWVPDFEKSFIKMRLAYREVITEEAYVKGKKVIEAYLNSFELYKNYKDGVHPIDEAYRAVDPIKFRYGRKYSITKKDMERDEKLNKKLGWIMADICYRANTLERVWLVGAELLDI